MPTIACQLLMGSYQATDPTGGADEPEWPPHPYRLFAGLVHAACERGGEVPDEEDVAALRWLERLPPPDVTFDADARPRTTATVYVPRNPMNHSEVRRDATSGMRMRLARTLPTMIVRDHVVRFHWTASGPTPPALEGLAERVCWLGSSRSPVACRLEHDDRLSRGAGTTALAPRPGGRQALRTVIPGSTDALLASRHAWPPPRAYVTMPYADDASPTVPPEPRGPYAGGLLVRAITRPLHDLRHAWTIGSQLRRAVLSRAGDAAPPALHGHDRARGHAAYLSLADVGHPDASGLVRGVAMVLPSDLGADERLACIRALGEVNEIVHPRLGRIGLGPNPDGGSRTLNAERWSAEARAWSSVTPIVLDRFPRRGRTPEDELRRTIENAGWPDPEAIELYAGPAQPGGSATGRLPQDAPAGLRVHAWIRFPTAVRGPVLLGRGRFRGVGLLAPGRSPQP